MNAGYPPVNRGSFRSEVWVFVQCAILYAGACAYVAALYLLIRAAI